MEVSETNYYETMQQEPVEYEVKEKKKTNYKALITYAIAVVCLLLGLFLPLFGDKGILALQLPAVINKLMGTSLSFGKEEFAPSEPALLESIELFGMEALKVELIYWVMLLYAVVTVLSLLALIPVGIGAAKGKRSAEVWAYIMETAAVVVLSVYMLMVIPNLVANNKAIDYNLLIAFGGPLLILIVQAFMFKKATGFVKVVLFLLSAIALFVMFDVFGMITKLQDPVKDLLGEKLTISALYVSEGSEASRNGIDFINLLFREGKFIPDQLSTMETADEAAYVLAIIACSLVVLNYFFDVLGLSTKGKTAGYFLNLIRYSLEVAAFIALLITLIVAKSTLGLLLIVAMAMAVIQLLISVIRFIMNHKRRRAAMGDDYEEEYEESEYEEDPYYYTKEKKGQNTKTTQTTTQTTAPTTTHDTIIPDNYTTEPQPIAPPAEPATFPVYDEFAPSTVQAEPAQPAPVYTEPTPVVEPVAAEPTPVQPEPVYTEPTPVVEPVVESVAPATPATPAEPVEPVEPATPVQPVQPEDHGDAFQSRTPFGETPETPAFYEEPEEVEPEEELPPFEAATDEFMDKLSNEEKYEFADLFINKTIPDIGKIPTYNVNGNNKKFFSAVFIYLGKIRPVISDGLLNKIYQEMQML